MIRSRLALATLALLTLAAPAPRAQHLPDAAPARSASGGVWLPGDRAPELDGTVLALAPGADGALYAAGDGVLRESQATHHLARWTPDARGGTWSSIGEATDSPILAMAPGPDGSLYVGGEFWTAGGHPARRVARWTPDAQGGGTWSSLGEGLDGGGHLKVSALAVTLEGVVYVGGEFYTAGGQPAVSVARWTPDGSGGGTWSPLGEGVLGRVLALALGPDGSLYVGGEFETAGGQPAHNVARWTPDENGGGTWGPLGAGIAGFVSHHVAALAFDASGVLYVGGRFQTAGGQPARHLARWTPDETGSGAWSPLLGSPGGDGVRALAFDASGALFVGGGLYDEPLGITNIARWAPDEDGGGTWSPLGHGADEYVEALLADSAGAVYAGGGFASVDLVRARNVIQWTSDTGWSPLGSGLNEPVSVLATAPDGTVYAGGTFTAADGKAARHVAQWVPGGTAGGHWQPLEGGPLNGEVRALVVAGDGTIYAGGTFTEAGGQEALHVARWTPDEEGSGAWGPLGVGLGAPPYAHVSALALGPDGTLYAGGWFTASGGTTLRNLARWLPDGNGGGAWSPLGSGVAPGPDNTVLALAVTADGSVYAGGRFIEVGGVSAIGLARWTPDGEGGAWSALGGGVDIGGPLHAVQVLLPAPNGSVYVGGRFITPGTSDAGGLGVWTPGANGGGAWSGLGFSAALQHVYALALDAEGGLYAGGSIETAGGVPVRGVARRAPDGTWSALGEGLTYGLGSASVHALTVSPEGLLYAGGWITHAGGAPSAHFARWQPASVSTDPGAAPPVGLAISTYPNPFAGRATVAFVLPEAGPIRVDVYDLLGREVARLASGEWHAGAHEVIWEGSGLAPGVYVVRAVAGGASAARRVTVAP